MLIASVPTNVRAEESVDDTTVNTGTGAPADAGVPNGNAPAPKPYSGLPVLRNVMRAKGDNIENNEEFRNKILKNIPISSTTKKEIKGDLKYMASTTRMERKDIRDDRREEVDGIRKDGRQDMRNASSSMDRREIRKEMHRDIYKARKDAIVKQLILSLQNIKQIRERVSSRIDKMSAEGTDVTSIKALLATADDKITLAQQAIDAFAAFIPTASTTTSTAIDLGKPREAMGMAMKSVNQSREALGAVIRAIIKALGLDLKVPSPVPPVTSTTTSSTTTSI